MKNTFYPNVYDIILEHENDVNKSWEEMFKLTRFRARLKVLITYLEFKVDSSEQMERLRNNFKEIIQLSNQDYEPNEEYILIAGERYEVNKKDMLRWYYVTFPPNNIPITRVIETSISK